MRSPSTPTPQIQALQDKFVRSARTPGMRALAWDRDILYASRGYQLLRASMQDLPRGLNWQPVGFFNASWKRKLSASSRLTARLFRDGFHALAALPAGDLVAAVPGAILRLPANGSEFHSSFTIIRGTRPLHIAAVPQGTVFWGEYFDNALREEVHIYASTDSGATWNVAYTFPKAAIRHVHNIVHDPWQDCLWVLTGDYGDECQILRAACDFSRVEVVLQGKQQARAVAAVPTEDALYFSSDTPLESNFIYRLDRQENLSLLAPISSSSIYGARVGDRLFFSTMVEPSSINPDRNVRVYSGSSRAPERWQEVFHWRKDALPMGLFQYGNAFFPDGNNLSSYLALTTVAVESDDMVTSIFAV
jgi:hypothetical protein